MSYRAPWGTAAVAAVVLLLSQPPTAAAVELYASDRLSGSYFAPNKSFWLTGCTYFATPFTPTVSGPAKWLVFSLSEGPTYSRVRGLGVGIYTDAGGKPAATPFFAGFFKSIRDQNKPIQMSTGTSNWELPVFAYDIESANLTSGSAPALNLVAGTKYWLAAQQTRSYTHQLTGAVLPTTTALPTASAEPYFQTRNARVDVYTSAVLHATDIANPNDAGCPVGRYPNPAEMQAWRGPANVGSANPFRPINTRGVAFAICDATSVYSCGDANFPASPSTSRSPTDTRTPTTTPSVSSSVTASSSVSASETSSATSSESATASATATSSETPSTSITGSETKSVTGSATASKSLSASSSASRSITPSTSGSRSASPSTTGSGSGSATASESPSVTASETGSGSATASESGTATATGSESTTGSETASASVTASLSASPDYATPSESPSASASPVSPSATASESPTSSETASPSASAESPSYSPSLSSTLTGSTSASPSESASVTASVSSSTSVAPSPSESASATASETATGSATSSESASGSATSSITATSSATASETATSTASVSRTASGSRSPSRTVSLSTSPSRTPSVSISPSVSPSITPSSSESASASPSSWESTTPSPSGGESGTPSGSVTASRTPSASVEESRTPSASPATVPNVEVEAVVSVPNTVDVSAYGDEDMSNLFVGLKCDFARIGDVDVEDTILTSFTTYASGEAISYDVPPSYPVNTMDASSCGALTSTLNAADARRLSAGQPASDGHGAQPAAAAAAAARNLVAVGGGVAFVSTGFGVRFKLFVKTTSPAALKAPANVNAVDLVAQAVSVAVNLAPDAKNAVFALTALTWTASSNLTGLSDWNSLPLFDVPAVAGYQEVIANATYAATGVEDASKRDKLPIILGVSLGVTLGTSFVTLAAVLLVRRRRERERERTHPEAKSPEDPAPAAPAAAPAAGPAEPAAEAPPPQAAPVAT